MRAAWWRGRRAIAAITTLSAVVYTGHGLLRHLTFHSSAYDLGFFDQLTSNLSAGRGWSSSFIGYDFRGQHWEPILLVWAQLYRLASTPMWLLVVNGIGLALAPWAAWRLARCWLGDAHRGALIAALATALSPLVLRTAGFDYHSEALTPVLTLLALEAACRRRWLTLAACCALLVLLKEDAFLVVAGIGWLIWRVEGRRIGLMVSGAAVAGFVLVVGVYMPGLRGGVAGDLLARYAYLAPEGAPASPSAVLTGLLTHPTTWITHLTTGAPVEGLAVALLPLALLPLVSGWSLLAAAPPLLLAVLSGDPLQSALRLHYGIEAFPLLLACALLGWRRVERSRLAGARTAGRPLTIVATLVVLAAVPLTSALGGRLADMSSIGRVGAVRAVLDRVPAGVPVAASTGLVPQLSGRPVVTEFPDLREARWVVIDAETPQSSQVLSTGYYDESVARLARDYRIVAAAGGVTLWERR